MTTTREALAGEADIGGIKFWATSAQGPGPARRIIKYGGVGVEGQVTEDVGRDARTETLSALVDESIYIKLDNKKNEGKVVTAVHPLFGVMESRIENVTYTASPDEMVDIQVTLVEHGNPSILLPPTTVTTSGKIQDARSVWSDLNEDLGEMLSLSDITDDLTRSITNLQDSWSVFDGVMDLVEAGEAIIDDVGAAFNDLADYGNAAIESIDSAWNTVTDIVDYDIESQVYSLLDDARGVFDAMENQVTSVWSNFKVVESISVADLAREFLGLDDEESIQKILDRNPTVFDVNALPVGTEISVPVQ